MIDPAIRCFVIESEGFYPPDAASREVTEQRRLYDAYAAHFAVRRSTSVRSKDAMVEQAGRRVPVRLYEAATPARGLILYAHGGGFMLGSLDSHDGIVARVAELTSCAVVAIEYRLAPEHPAPAAHADVLTVVEAACEGRLPWADLPVTGIALLGDSAGGTLVASAALQVGRERPQSLAVLALVYPALGFEPAEPARSAEADAPMLTLEDVRSFRGAYLAGRDALPLTFVLDETDISALPPTVLLPAEHDPLRHDCTRFAERLRDCGIEVLLLRGTGLVHGCLRALDRAPAVSAPFAEMLRFIVDHLPASPSVAAGPSGRHESGIAVC